MPVEHKEKHVVALSGGVGGAKLALGLSRIADARNLTIVANTADDFEHLGLWISPDIDTVVYTLAGISNNVQGWGQEGETWQCMAMLEHLGGETWFRLGDRDLAMHLQRTHLLRRDGWTLTQATASIAHAIGVQATVLPMCDEPVATLVETTEGTLAFQHYFVREQCRPVVTGFRFEGLAQARANPQLVERCQRMTPSCIVFSPSNPYVSLDPILAVPGLLQVLRDQRVPVVAVSPIVAGKALKGPAGKMMMELGIDPSVLSIARRYVGIIDALVIDPSDQAHASTIEALGIRTCVVPTVMRSLADREQLARDVLRFADELAAGVAGGRLQ